MSDHSSPGSSSEQSARRLFTKRAFARRGAPLLLAAGILGAATLAGCGGGGGNGNSNGNGTTGTGTSGTGTTGTNTTGTLFNADISGKVTDTQGNGVPGVSIIPDSGGTVTLSLGQGGYRLNNLSGNVVHKITASVTQNNVQYTGSTQIYAQGDFLTTNANILLSPISRQATVSGTVRDVNGTAIANVQVSLALPNGTTAAPGKYFSLVAFTNASGVYTITNIPTDLPSSSPIVIAASATGAQNQTATLATVQAGGVYNHDFTLTGISGQSAAAPAILSVTTATEPTDSQSGRLRAAAATATAPTSIYDRIRRQLSPAYARAANNRVATSKRLTARAVGSYAVETDVAFTPPASGSVSYYNFYQTTGSTAITSTQGAFDSFSDPLATYYTALTFSTSTDNATLAGTQYNFALSAVSTNNLESALSQTFSIIPLGPISFSQPTVGQVYTTTATLTWNAVTGATKYYVFVYDQYPTFAGNPSPVASTTTPLAAGTLTYTPSLLVGKDYYAVVVATADPNETPGQSNLHPIVNGVMSFSQITRFHLQ